MTLFQFEADFVESLRCIPMYVRYKLDTCGVKLKLEHWKQLNQKEKQALVEMPCEPGDGAIAYRDFLQALVIEHTGHPAKTLTVDNDPVWMDSSQVPQQVQEKTNEFDDVTLSVEQWASLNPLQRFALIKLSRPSHENRNFLSAIKEFDLS